MKHSGSTFCWLLILLGTLLLGCKKNKEETPVVRMTAMVQGLPWVAYNAQVRITKTPSIHLSITADSSDTHIELNIHNYNGPGTYSLWDSGNSAQYRGFIEGYGYNTFTATSGQVTVDSNLIKGTTNTNLKGTFRFMGGPVTVTDGAFDVQLLLD